MKSRQRLEKVISLSDSISMFRSVFSVSAAGVSLISPVKVLSDFEAPSIVN